MKTIKLGGNNDESAIVDDEDYDVLVKSKWFCSRGYAKKYTYDTDSKKTRTQSMHREIIKTPKGLDTDHINGDKMDNRKANLRVCTRSENMGNTHNLSRNTSGYKGVCWSKKSSKWAAHITRNYQQIHLGFFANKEDAAVAYNKKAKELFGEFANINKVETE